MSDIKRIINAFAKEFNAYIAGYFPLPDGPEKRVVEAMAYSVTNGGKRLRPFLVAETSKLFDVLPEQYLRVGAALECLHSYSLIHDDLPAMDNDDLRRGKPTCHKQFDEATAILAGDGLLTYAFEILSHKKTAPDARTRCQLIQLLAQGAGAFTGMVAGQMLDLYAERETPVNDQYDLIKNIEAMKTGRLLRFACEAGSVLGGASTEEHNALMLYAGNIGMAFQIADDILDVTGNQELVGKTLNKDAAQDKLTFVSLCGIDEARAIAVKLVEDAKASLSIFGEKANTLKDLAQYIIDRDK